MKHLSTTFDEHLGILILTLEDQYTSQSVRDYYADLARNSKFPRDLRIICYISTTRSKIRPEDIDEMVNSLKEASNKYERLTEAFVADDPYSTVLTTLFSEKAQIENYRSKVFSTKEAALKWLLD